MRFEASKLNESVMVFTKDQTEEEIDEIHSKYRKKHHNEFQLLVDQAKKGYKKAAGMAKNQVSRREDESTGIPSSMCMDGEDDEMKFSAMTSVTNHCTHSKRGSPEKLAPERPADSSHCSDVQEATVLSSDSGSCNSSSSDIIRDLLEEEEAWEAAHGNDPQDVEISPRQNRRARAASSAEVEPRNKRTRN